MTRAANIDLPARILEEAEKVVIASGYQGINMRRLARAVGVSATAIYHYFESKETILRKLRLRATEKLNDMIRAIDPGLSPRRVSRGARQAVPCLRAGESQPVSAGVRGSPRRQAPARRTTPSCTSPTSRLGGALEKMAKDGAIKHDPRLGAMMGWMMLHGFCSLMMSGMLPPAEGMTRESLQELVHAILPGRAARLMARSDVEPALFLPRYLTSLI